MSKGGGGGAPTESTVIQSNLPEYAEPFYRSLLARVGYESALPYETYPGQRLAYFNPAEQEAQRRFEQLGVSGTPDELLAAGDIAAQVGQGNPYARSMLDAQYQAQQGELNYVPGTQKGITDALPDTYQAGTFTDPSVAQSYMNPYEQLVIDREKEEARRQSEIMGQQASLQAAGSGSLGGYREAIMQAERERNLEDQLGDIQARGLQRAFTEGRQAFGEDEARRQQQFQSGLGRFQAGIGAMTDVERMRLQQEQANEAARQEQARLAQSGFGQLLSADQQRLAAAGMMGDFVSQRQAMELERLRQMQASGQIERELMQRGLDIGYTDFLRQQAFPKEQLSFYSSMLQGVPIAPGQVSQSYGITPSTTQQLLGSGIAGVGLYNALRGG